ncbi:MULTISPECIES: class I SAM-dependent methyltransferase [Methylobacterium]|uniref:Ubiquinone biosynthesis O-methyltransferase, mitochondrial n=1 Tax=Methylobacterium thuringiense TaxID=1003091 RepID=A0ABQ4TLY5_9HYPH|nr:MULTISPECIES: class I SAM-dependent methyltransferase [Methylobacterium]TXN22973.1 class I SAM-dependent methyltransferase [Methylobacterium sp. WL9]GJE55622.1 Ubiquinone biosynthesis O-methyltransferase, mitochondrial [Methylobacterium thuringiense]
MTPPPCPITGEPAIRLVQWVGAGFLADLWRITLRVDALPSFKGTTRFGLWESATGLYFFDPMLEGDAGFYRSLYERLSSRYYPREGHPRSEFTLAARHIRPNERVLDVGCGFGAFRHAVHHARYTGLDPHFSGEPGSEWARIETLTDHLAAHAGAYDACTAFQVLEHVENPVAMLGTMMRAVRPGGRVIIGVPHVPAAHTRIPNYLINAVPHHLTWWTADALTAIAARVGLVNATVETAPWADVDGLVYWMARCSPVKCRDRHYRHSWAWHASTVIGFLGGYAMWTIKPTPKTTDEGASLLLVADTPAG